MNFSAPLNNVSLGHVGQCILRELYNRGKTVNLFPVAPPDLSAYNIETDFSFWLNSCLSRATKHYKKHEKGFKLWHISGAEQSISSSQTLLTFHELDNITAAEANILSNQHRVLVSSSFSKKVFEEKGLTNVSYCPLGFDAHHFKESSRPKNSDKIVFSLFGKFEKRKHTTKVIQSWLKKYKNDARYTLNLHVYNPFFSPEQNNQVLLAAFGGVKPWNVNCLGYLPTLRELNDCYNVADIVLDMSGGEGFSMPSFHTLALGKHGVIHNCSSIADWAERSGAVLINPSGKEPVYDSVFFKEGGDFSQGNIFTWNEEKFLAGCDEAIRRYKINPLNEQGRELQKQTWKETVDIIEAN